jgi:hypothetical protein
LSPLALGALVVVSTALFLFYGGALWLAAPEASHVGRFAVSYLAVPPLAALLLLAVRRFSGTHVLTAIGVTWGIKLVVTSVLYFAAAPGTAHVPTAASATVAPTVPKPAATVPEYGAAGGDFTHGDIRATVVRGGVPVPGAVVFLDRPSPGLPAGETGAVTIGIRGSRYGAPAYLVPASSDLKVESADTTLHTLHLYEGSRAVLNVPLTAAAGSRQVPSLEPGIYEARCDTHATERAAVVVVDHPYAIVADQAGQALLGRVPAGPVTLVVVTGEPGPVAVRRVRARVEPGLTTTLDIDLSAPEVPEEAL